MAYFTRNLQRYSLLKPIKSDMILSTSRFAKKKIDPFIEVKEKKSQDILNPLKKENMSEKIKNKIIREFIPLAIGLGLCGYMIYLLFKKRKESSNLDELNVKK